ncbi:suppressor of hpr1 [Meristemomyces frigidus]|nr:suppressor of hpr1 [Meristemomyces frigidus]
MAAATTHSNGTFTPQARDPDFYAGATRFELELEFVQALSNPLYIHHLATQKHLEDPDFVRYLAYLQYFREDKYIRYLQYPAPTLRALALLQQPQFRQDAITPALIDQLVREGFEAATKGLSQ